MEHEINMKKHIFKIAKISNPQNKKKIDRNRNIVLQNHTWIIPLYSSLNHNLLEQVGAC